MLSDAAQVVRIMPRFILVPATGAETDAPVFSAALQVARAWAGHLEFLHVRADVAGIISAVATADTMGSGAVTHLIDALDRDVAVRHEKAEKSVREFCVREQLALGEVPVAGGASAEWQVETGDERLSLTAHARTADLAVVGRAHDQQTIAVDLLDGLLMETGKPVLIASAKPLTVHAGTVVIAWKDTREAARAVAAALPFIERAGRVIILSVEEDKKSAEASCARLRHSLQWHNSNTTVQHLTENGRPPVEMLLEVAAAHLATLLVMGGYSHSRMREIVFGGFTRRVLVSADLPVLMAR